MYPYKFGKNRPLTIWGPATPLEPKHIPKQPELPNTSDAESEDEAETGEAQHSTSTSMPGNDGAIRSSEIFIFIVNSNYDFKSPKILLDFLFNFCFRHFISEGHGGWNQSG